MKRHKKVLVLLGVLMAVLGAASGIGLARAQEQATCQSGDFCFAPKLNKPIKAIHSVNLPKIAVPSWLGAEEQR